MTTNDLVAGLTQDQEERSLGFACPICGAQRGQRCRNSVNGQERDRPHCSRPIVGSRRPPRPQLSLDDPDGIRHA